MKNYLQQKAAPWVSFSVLAGGLASAIILFFLVKVEQDIQALTIYNESIVWELES
jgi:hypothetical protein